MLRKFFCPAIFLLFAGTILAQSTPPTTAPPPAQGRAQGSCWQQAGIERSVADQVRSIGRDAHSQVVAVCSNTSLTPQQKRQQVREIHQQAKEKREGLITVAQEKALTACQQARNGRPHPGMGDGCGDLPRNGSQPNGNPNGTPENGSGNPPPSNQ